MLYVFINKKMEQYLIAAKGIRKSATRIGCYFPQKHGSLLICQKEVNLLNKLPRFV